MTPGNATLSGELRVMARNVESEMEFINLWMRREHPNANVYGKMRVGRPPAGDVLVGVTRVYPDKIFIENGAVFIVEGKIVPTSAAVGQLENYVRLFPETPEFFFAKDYPVKGILLVAVDRSQVRTFAESKGFEYVVFKPPEVEQIVRDRLRID